ncbi:MAG: ABC transporter substrate-binding protein, partial [Defluviitaleaceae bacterium]|nr:ABC transporter substrate-binding protein [Defluviitaleaceae bacterium]
VINDDHNITILLNQPFSAAIAQLTHSATQIVSEVAVTSAGDTYNESPVGTGAFMFSNIVLGDRVELVRFEDYWRGSVPISRLTYRVIPEAANRLIEVESGNADIALMINPSDVARVEESPNMELHRNMSLTTSFVGFNNQVWPFTDVRVRQAISYALDTEAIVNNVFLGQGRLAHEFLPDTIWAHEPQEPFPFDIERAQELLAEAGLADGFSTTIWYNGDSQQRRDIANIVQNQLRQLNIEISVEPLEWATYLGRIAQGEHEMFILQWTHTTGEPDSGTFNLFHSQNHGGAGNRQFYTNPVIDSLISEGRAELDPARRAEIFSEIQQIIRDDAPLVYLQQSEEMIVTTPAVRGLEVSPTGLHFMRTVYFD